MWIYHDDSACLLLLKKYLYGVPYVINSLTRTLFILSFILLIIGVLQYWVMKDFLYDNEAEMSKSQNGRLLPP